MKVFKSQTRTSVTEYIERMTSQQYKEDDLTDIFILCEAINLQGTGPKEASQALRSVFKYGSKHSQLKALTILQALMENCEKIHPYVASHKFIDKLKNLALSSSTDDEVHKQLMILFAQWSSNYNKKSGMESITSLYSIVSNKSSGSSGSGHNTSIRKSSTDSTSSTKSSSSSHINNNINNIYNNDKKEKRRSILLNKNLNNKKKQQEQQSSSKPNKPETYTPSKVNQEIGLAIQNATNLVNALTLLNPDMDFENDDELQECVTKCKTSSEQLIKIIPTIVDSTQLGPLLQCNDQIQGALALYSKHCEDCKQSDVDDVTFDFENIKLQNNTREKKSFDYTKSNKEFEDLIDFDSYVSSTTSTTTSNKKSWNNIDNIYSKNLTDDPFEDPFADPITPSRTPDPEAEKKIKTHPKWTEV